MAKKASASGIRTKKPPPAAPGEYQLMLFVTGATPNSVRAVANVRRICNEHLKGRHSLEIIDVYLQREIASHYQLVALPLLLKKAPEPVKRIIGDFSDENKVLSILNLI